MTLSAQADKAEQREQLKADIEAYLKRGGEITVIPTGEQTVDYTKPRSWQDLAQHVYGVSNEAD